METSWRSRVCIWEHLVRHLELLAVGRSRFVALELFLNLSSYFFCISDSATTHFNLSMSQLFVSSSVVFGLSCLSPGFCLPHLILSPSAPSPLLCFWCFSSITASLFLTALANPVQRLSETFSGIVNKCLQRCADMSWCRCYSCEKAELFFFIW